MKRFVILLLTAVLALTMPLSALAAGQIEVTEDISVSDDYDWTRFKGQNMTLNVYNWGEYISNGSDDSLDVVSAFEDLTGIKVNYSSFDTDETMLAKLETAKGGDYDVVIADDYIIETAIAEGLVMELDKSKIANIGNVNPVYQGQFFDPEDAYTVPYGAGVQTIVYNPDLVDIEINGYEDLWDAALESSLASPATSA